MNSLNVYYVGIYFCPVCNETHRYYTPHRHNKKNWMKASAHCEKCRVVRVIYRDDEQFNNVGVRKDDL